MGVHISQRDFTVENWLYAFKSSANISADSLYVLLLDNHKRRIAVYNLQLLYNSFELPQMFIQKVKQSLKIMFNFHIHK